MGSYQVKCGCGTPAVSLVIFKNINILKPNYYQEISRISGYNFFQYFPDDKAFVASTCEECAAKIKKKFEDNNLEYSLEEKPDGVWRVSLP